MRQLVSIALLTAGLGPVAGCTGGPEPVAPRRRISSASASSPAWAGPRGAKISIG